MKTKEDSYFSLKNKTPLLVLLIWTSFIGFFIWQRANQSDRPPIFDALTYYQKAKNVWENARQGFPLNPLNTGPSVRPPGTVLVSYPFGFDEDYHGFLFRSVFIPFLMWIIAILILTWPRQKTDKEKAFWPPTITALLFGPLPFFFQFDFGNTAYWGLVDSFLASMSALALVIGIKSIEKKSRSLLLFSILLTSICPFIKPAGCLIFFLVALCWSMLCLVRFFNENSKDKNTSSRFWWTGTLLFGLTGILILYLVKTSDYLGQNTVSAWTQAMVILNEDSKESSHLSVFASMFYNAVGPQFLIYVSAFIFLLFRSVKKVDQPLYRWALLLSSFIFISVGIWFWVWMTGISQIRYFYPFLLLGFVPFIYYAFDILDRQKIGLNPAVHAIFKIVCFLPAVNLLLLLSMVNPNNTWQDISKVAVNISRNDPGVKIVKQFLSYIANEKERPTVYDTNLGYSNNAFTSYGVFNQLIHPEVVGFTTIHPVDWARPNTYRLTEIIKSSDFILFKPLRQDRQQEILADTVINIFEKERDAIEAFLNTLTPAQGLQTIFEERDCRLSKITDKNKLIHAFEPFLYSRQWRPLFMEENKITHKGWRLFPKPLQGMPKGYIQDTSVRYAGSIDLINGISSSRVVVQSNKDVTLEGWLVFDVNKEINADDIFVVVIAPDGTQQFWPTNQQQRPGLTTGNHQSVLINAGFNSIVEIGNQPGMYTIMLAAGYQGRFIHCKSIKGVVQKE